MLTEPVLLNNLPILSLSGIGVEPDQLALQRNDFMQVLEEKVQDAEVAEAVLDVNIRWTTPAKPEPNV